MKEKNKSPHTHNCLDIDIEHNTIKMPQNRNGTMHLESKETEFYSLSPTCQSIQTYYFLFIILLNGAIYIILTTTYLYYTYTNI